MLHELLGSLGAPSKNILAIRRATELAKELSLDLDFMEAGIETEGLGGSVPSC